LSTDPGGRLETMLHGAIDFLASVEIARLAAHPVALVLTGIVFVLAVLFRWKTVLLFLFAVGATLAVLRYSRLSEGHTAIDLNMAVFAVGSLLIGVVLIYFLFISGD
jgi:hypothetical protein